MKDIRRLPPHLHETVLDMIDLETEFQGEADVEEKQEEVEVEVEKAEDAEELADTAIK